MSLFSQKHTKGTRKKIAMVLTCTCLGSFVLMPGLAAAAETKTSTTQGKTQIEETTPPTDVLPINANPTTDTPPEVTPNDNQTDKQDQTIANFNKIVLTLNSKKVIVNDTEKTIEATPFLATDTTMVPLRFIGETVLNCGVEYVASNKTINLTRFDLKAVVDLNKGTVLVDNGTDAPYQLKMGTKPQLKGDYTYMPLRFFSELFGCTVDYAGATKTITIKAPIVKEDPSEKDPTIPAEPKPGAPYAQIGFSATPAGGPLQYVDSSYDPNGLSIMGHQWMVEKNGKFISAPTIEELMKNAPANSYNVYYRVKNSNNIWSTWFLTQVVITPNEKPIISDLKVVKASGESGSINQGEAVDFTYTTTNEEWEKITESRWVYSYTKNGRTTTAVGKPEAFFSDDTYDVTLKIKDAYGNWSDAVTASVTPSKTIVASEAAFKFANLKPGEIYLNNKNLNFNEIAKTAEPETVIRENVNLLASNNPESVTANAILCQDTLNGAARLRFHHMNNTGANMKLYAVAQNEGTTPVTLTITNFATAGPNPDVIQVGSSVVENYLTYNKAPYTKTLKPGEIYLFNANTKVMPEGTSSAGLIDFSTTGPVKCSILSMKETSSYKDYKYLGFAPENSTHIRGTFPNGTMSMTYTLNGKEAQKIVLGREDAAPDYYVTGMDKITGMAVTNKGNRGVVHHLTIKAENKVALLFNPRGAMYKGVIKNIDGRITHLSTAGLMQGIVESCTLATIEAGETKTLTYLAPSGSDTPLLIVALPFDQLDKY